MPRPARLVSLAIGLVTVLSACSDPTHTDLPPAGNVTYRGSFASGTVRGTISLTSGSPATGTLTVDGQSPVSLSGTFAAKSVGANASGTIAPTASASDAARLSVSTAATAAATPTFTLAGGGFTVQATVAGGAAAGTVSGPGLDTPANLAAVAAAPTATVSRYCGVFMGDDSGMIEVITTGGVAVIAVTGMGGGYVLTGTSSGSSITASATGGQPPNTVTADLTVSGESVSGTGRSTLYPTQRVTLAASTGGCAAAAQAPPFDSYLGVVSAAGNSGDLQLTPTSPATGSMTWKGATIRLSGTYANGAFDVSGGGFIVRATASGANLTGTLNNASLGIVGNAFTGLGSSPSSRAVRFCGTYTSAQTSGKLVYVVNGSLHNGVILTATAALPISGTVGSNFIYAAYLNKWYVAGQTSGSSYTGTWTNDLGLAGAWTASPCSVPAAPVASVTVNQSTANIFIGATQTFTAEARDASGAVVAGRTIAWSTSDANIATVSPSGVVTAIGSGTATITAFTLDGVAGTLVVTVPARIGSIDLNPASLTLVVGGTQAMSATMRDFGGNIVTGRAIAWSSSNVAVASISAAGVVTGASIGTANISASADAGNIVVTTTVTVNAAPPKFVQIGAGSAFTCGLINNGAVYCWGINGYSQLGNVASYPIYSPTRVLGGLSFTDIAVGLNHACGRTAAGAVYCWGDVMFNQFSAVAAPTLFSGGLSLAEVSAGTATCGRTTNSVVYCWGFNSAGQLGDGTTISRATPAPIAGGVLLASVIAGVGTSCGITSSGAAFCWGANGRGQIGDGSTETRLTPVPVTGGLTFTMVKSGAGGQTCGLASGGAMYCWGEGTLIGDGTNVSRASPTLVASHPPFTDFVVGGSHTCALTSAGAAYCWGRNGWGELGDGTLLPRLTPTLVAGGVAFVKLSAGDMHTCGLTSAGDAYCWGNNSTGAIGDGSTFARLVPTLVKFP